MLHSAVCLDDVEELEQALSEGASADSMVRVDDQLTAPPLMLAIHLGHNASQCA
jgi:hypothetical protein